VALAYSLEYSSETQDAVYIDLRENPSIFQDRISVEVYDSLPIGDKNAFLTDIFNVGGVVEFATSAYSMWVMKADQFTWSEVLADVLNITSNDLGEGGFLAQLSGSASTKGPEDPEQRTAASDGSRRRSLAQGLTVEGSSGTSFAMSGPVKFATMKKKRGR
jgi:hypothetical protein